MSSTCSRAPSTPTVDLLLGAALVLIVLTRQFLAMTDNQRLLVALGEARDQLEHQALHDALTGLANRVLFADRLDRALLQPDADGQRAVLRPRRLQAGQRRASGTRPVTCCCSTVAARLLDCVRATDTVARLGGDEFAILLEDSADARAGRRPGGRRACREPRRGRRAAPCGPRSASASPTTGACPRPSAARERRETPVPLRRTQSPARPRSPPPRSARQPPPLLLRHADTAMYAAKGAGKSRAVLADVAGPRSDAG